MQTITCGENVAAERSAAMAAWINPRVLEVVRKHKAGWLGSRMRDCWGTIWRESNTRWGI